jgi:hypothetical protein
LAIVEEPAVQDGPVLGVVSPSPDDAKEFIFHLSAFLGALRSGAQLTPRTPPTIGSRRG